MNARKIAKVGILTAITVILSLIKIPIIPMAPFLTLDCSDLPLMLVAKKDANTSRMILALATILIILFNGGQLAIVIGLIAQVIFSLFMIEGIHKKWSIFKILTIEILMMIILNLIVVLPLYQWALDFHLSYSIWIYVIGALIPFNFIKGVILMILYRMFRNVG